MPKWDKYLDDDYEDSFKQVERIPQKPKRPENDATRRDGRKESPKHPKN